MQIRKRGTDCAHITGLFSQNSPPAPFYARLALKFGDFPGLDEEIPEILGNHVACGGCSALKRAPFRLKTSKMSGNPVIRGVNWLIFRAVKW